MAKINARGATEVGRVTKGTGNMERLYVMCSDGRVLTRFVDPATDWIIWCRWVQPSKRNQAGLAELIGSVVKDG